MAWGWQGSVRGGSWVSTGSLGASLAGLGVLLRRRAAPPKHPAQEHPASAFSQPVRGLANFQLSFGRCWAAPDGMTYPGTILGSRCMWHSFMGGVLGAGVLMYNVIRAFRMTDHSFGRCDLCCSVI